MFLFIILHAFYSLYSNVTYVRPFGVINNLGIPRFDTVLANAACSFEYLYTCMYL